MMTVAALVSFIHINFYVTPSVENQNFKNKFQKTLTLV